uniref:Putative ovule protein n=1 Tax=Solanum chacoense TaxID=4108 RepID=A0A0V0IRA5_SOLCH
MTQKTCNSKKRTGLDKEEDLLTDLTPNIPEFVKCLKGYNVKKSCFLYVPKSFCEQLPKSDNKTAGVLCNSEGKRWKVKCKITKRISHFL